MASLDQTDIEAKKAILSRAPLSRDQQIREEQLAETAAREKRRNVFGVAGFTNATDGSDFAAVDDQMINHESATTGDWGGCGSPELPPEEQAFEDFMCFEAEFEYDAWNNYDWNDGISPMTHYFETGYFDTSDPQTSYFLYNTQLVVDDEGVPMYVDDGASCINPSSSLGQALIAGRAQLEMEELAQAAAETPLDISNPEISALVAAASYNDDGQIVYDGQTVDPNSIEGLRITQAREYMEAGAQQDTVAKDDPATPDAETGTAAPTTTTTADAEGPETAAPVSPQGNDVAAVAAATGPTADTPAEPDPKADPEFQALLTKLELTPEQLAQRPAPPPEPVAVQPVAAPRFEQAF